MTRLILARHGQTDSNARRILDSAPPGPPLNALGLAQAAALGERLRGERIDVVHASVATRAQETATPVAATRGLDVGVVEGVHEVFCGDLEGRADDHARERFEAVYAAWLAGDLGAHLPGGESALDLRTRFLPAVEEITDGVDGTVLLASHGAAIRLASAALLGDTAETTYVPNTGLVILTGTPATGWTLEHWDTAAPVVGDVTAGGPAD
ncbi:histidine phosphatase family protein [Pseudonocardia abyssalis]|uniref:Histidine phosphatase family protein n=1 Tax=Pseudonocardia abyssalis TaxID=2792008 RepID=A0ABS6UY39_9PSEU|nr:histidine phosphatase family protein [Pseudonocardia abyssalis]MBW0116964.1 histidine phosphatase family protein [Pseudonocardia abyssalis]MBW0137139.1 histidine phosphatase family protein [Pseudonocardia abyssalis]